MRASHVLNGDTVMVTLDVPAADVYIATRDRAADFDLGTIAITMEGSVWHDAAKRVLRQHSIAEHELDPDVIAGRALEEIRRAVVRGATSFAEPDVQRRRAISNALLKLSDLILAGTIQDLTISWQRDLGEISLNFQIGPQGRRRRRIEVLPIEIPGVKAEPAA